MEMTTELFFVETGELKNKMRCYGLSNDRSTDSRSFLTVDVFAAAVRAAHHGMGKATLATRLGFGVGAVGVGSSAVTTMTKARR